MEHSRKAFPGEIKCPDCRHCTEHEIGPPRYRCRRPDRAVYETDENSTCDYVAGYSQLSLNNEATGRSVLRPNDVPRP